MSLMLSRSDPPRIGGLRFAAPYRHRRLISCEAKTNTHLQIHQIIQLAKSGLICLLLRLHGVVPGFALMMVMLAKIFDRVISELVRDMNALEATIELAFQ